MNKSAIGINSCVFIITHYQSHIKKAHQILTECGKCDIAKN